MVEKSKVPPQLTNQEAIWNSLVFKPGTRKIVLQNIATLIRSAQFWIV